MGGEEVELIVGVLALDLEGLAHAHEGHMKTSLEHRKRLDVRTLGEAELPDDLPDDLEDSFEDIAPRKQPIPFPSKPGEEKTIDAGWKRYPTSVRFIGFGPEFEQSGYEQNGHIRVDFGLDTPWVLEDEELDKNAAKHIQQNVEMLLAFTLLVEKHCNISSRLLWTESGEPLAEKLIARLQRLN